MADNISEEYRGHLLDFQTYLHSVGVAKNTISSYSFDVERFLRFLDGNGMDIQHLDQNALLQFMGRLAKEGLRSSTRRRIMEGLKAFFQAMTRMGKVKDDPFSGFQDMPRARDKEMRFLTEMEYRSLRDVVRSSRRKSGVRDYAILELALQTGLRRAEICSLKQDDVQFSTRTTVGSVRVGQGKGGKERTVTMNDAAEKAIKEYLAVRPKDTEYQEMFLNNRHKPCDPVAISSLFRRYMDKAGIKDASFHSLRHTFATHSLNKGTNIIVVQEALGHKSLTSTQKYVHFLREMMDQQLKKNEL